MDAKALRWCDRIVADVIGDVLEMIADRTGMRWGVMLPEQYWFQPPKLHVLLCVAVLAFCEVLRRQSRGFRLEAITRLRIAGQSRSLKCPANKRIAYVLMSFLVLQVYTKGSRPNPFVQLGWLLMPCHIFTAMWIYIFLLDRPHQYGNACYLASLLVDWAWCPILALIQPDWGDSQHFWEKYVFFMHHGLLLVLPVYYTSRYNTLNFDFAHLCHLTWVPTVFNFAFLTPCALLLGLNVNYQLAPPRLGRNAPAVLSSVLYRPAFVVIFMALSTATNISIRFFGQRMSTSSATLLKLRKLE